MDTSPLSTFLRVAAATHPSLPTAITQPASELATSLLSTLVTQKTSTRDLNTIAAAITHAGHHALAKKGTLLFGPIEGRKLSVPLGWQGPPCPDAGAFLRTICHMGQDRVIDSKEAQRAGYTILQASHHKSIHAEQKNPAFEAGLHALCLLEEPGFWNDDSYLRNIAARRIASRTTPWDIKNPEAARAFDRRLRAVLDDDALIAAFCQTHSTTTPLNALSQAASLCRIGGASLLARGLLAAQEGPLACHVKTAHDMLRVQRLCLDPQSFYGLDSYHTGQKMHTFFLRAFAK